MVDSAKNELNKLLYKEVHLRVPGSGEQRLPPPLHCPVNEKYIHNLVKMMSPVKKSKTPGAGIEDGKVMIEDDLRRPMYRSAVGTLLYMAGNRPDIQLHVKELAGRLQSPTEGAWKACRSWLAIWP